MEFLNRKFIADPGSYRYLNSKFVPIVVFAEIKRQPKSICLRYVTNIKKESFRTFYIFLAHLGHIYPNVQIKLK